MKRSLKADELKLWTVVASTVRPGPGRALLMTRPEAGEEKNASIAASPKKSAPLQAQLSPPKPAAKSTKSKMMANLDPIEPLRKRRIARERELIEARLDLHGLDQDRARNALHDFLQRAHGQGLRAVLVITGKGTLGDGVLRRRTPDWLSEPIVRPLIAGFSPAERHHGGEGALYIALKRNRL